MCVKAKDFQLKISSKKVILRSSKRKKTKDELIDAMNDRNDQLKDEMMGRILDRFETVGDEKKKLKGKKVEAKKNKMKVGSAMMGECRRRGK